MGELTIALGYPRVPLLSACRKCPPFIKNRSWYNMDLGKGLSFTKMLLVDIGQLAAASGFDGFCDGRCL